MRYRAKPVIVDAFIITTVSEIRADGSMRLTLQDGTIQRANKAMLARFIPEPGDYWVVQSDSYEYVNPKEVFERKYEPCETESPKETARSDAADR